MGQPPASLPLDAIIVGERHRREMGDLDALAASMLRDGLLQPVCVKPQGELIDGERRLLAARRLGWREIAVHVVDLNEIVRGEYAANAFRKNFTLSEAVAIKRALEPLKRAAAETRMRAGKPSANLAEGTKGKSRDQVAAFTGYGRTTLAKATAVVEAGEQDPERFGKLVEAMDRSGRADGPYRRLMNAKQNQVTTVICPWQRRRCDQG